jgi:hypothetical protein
MPQSEWFAKRWVNRALVAFIIAGTTTIGLVVGLVGLGTSSGAVHPAQPVRSVSGYSYVCVGEIPQICTMINPQTGEPVTQTR